MVDNTVTFAMTCNLFDRLRLISQLVEFESSLIHVNLFLEIQLSQASQRASQPASQPESQPASQPTSAPVHVATHRAQGFEENHNRFVAPLMTKVDKQGEALGEVVKAVSSLSADFAAPQGIGNGEIPRVISHKKHTAEGTDTASITSSMAG